MSSDPAYGLSPTSYTPTDYADLRNALAALSLLLASPPDDNLFSDPLSHPTLQSAWQHLSRVLQRHPNLSLSILPDGHIYAFQQPVLSPDPSSSSRRAHLGSLLSSQGIERLSFSSLLEPTDLALFISILQFHTTPHPDGEHDLVTHWFDLHNPNIRFDLTAAPPSLASFAPPPSPDTAPASFHIIHALSLTAHQPQKPLISATSAPLPSLTTSSTQTFPVPSSFSARPSTFARSPTSTRLPTLPSLPPLPAAHNPAAAWLPLDARNRVVLDMLLQPLIRETDTSARKQFLHALLAATSCREPALSPQDFSFLFNKLFLEFITATEFEDAFQLIRNLEHFLERTAKVQSLTRDTASSSLSRLRSPRNILHLIRRLSTSDQFIIPRPLCRWLLSQDTLPLWSQIIPQTSPPDIPALVALFQTIFPPDDAFWTAALNAIPPTHSSIAQEVISQFGHTEAFNPSHNQRTPTSDIQLSSSILHTQSRPPSKIIIRSDTQSPPPQTEQGWDDFDFDNLLLSDPEDIPLDDDMAAFLDATPPPPPEKKRVPSEMIRCLDDIERNLPDDSKPPK